MSCSVRDTVERGSAEPRSTLCSNGSEHAQFGTRVLLFVAVTAVTLVVIWVARRRFRQQLLKSKKIPGPIVESLVFGHYMALRRSPILAIRQWTQQFGSVFGYYIGRMPYVAISDADIIRDLFVKKAAIFSERPPFAVQSYPLTNTLLCLAYDRWKKTRSVFSPAFSAAKLKVMTSLINNSALELVKVIKERSADGSTLCFFDLGQRLTLDVIARCALAAKINCIVDENDKFFNQMRDFLHNTEHFAFQLAHGLPSLERFLKMIARFTPTHKMMNDVMGHIRGVINHRKETGFRTNDMLQLMMDAAGPESQKITDDDVAANVFLFLVAAYETTAITFANACYLLAKYPDEQERLYDEVVRVCSEADDDNNASNSDSGGGDGVDRNNNNNKDDGHDKDQTTKREDNLTISYNQVLKLKRLEAFLLETLRLYPPIISLVSRVAGADVPAGGFTLPEGVRVQASVLEVHMNPQYWPEPERFRPERFIGTNAASQPHYLPFGIGPKACLGKRFAFLELKVTFAHLLRTSRLLLTDQLTDMPARKPINISLGPEGGMPLRVEART